MVRERERERERVAVRKLCRWCVLSWPGQPSPSHLCAAHNTVSSDSPSAADSIQITQKTVTTPPTLICVCVSVIILDENNEE